MRNNKDILTIMSVLLILFAYASVRFGKMYYHEAGEKRRLESAFNISRQETVYYKALNGAEVAKNDVMQLQYDELKKIYPEIIGEIRNLRIKPGRTNLFSESVIHEIKDIKTTLHDSVIFDTIPVRVFNYDDAYYHIKGIAVRDTQYVHIQSQDSIIQVVYKGERYKPWLWVFSRRKIQQVMSCKNPNDSIVFSKVIHITR